MIKYPFAIIFLAFGILEMANASVLGEQLQCQLSPPSQNTIMKHFSVWTEVDQASPDKSVQALLTTDTDGNVAYNATYQGIDPGLQERGTGTLILTSYMKVNFTFTPQTVSAEVIEQNSSAVDYVCNYQ
jgi:hypothetical protein